MYSLIFTVFVAAAVNIIGITEVKAILVVLHGAYPNFKKGFAI